MKRPSTAITAMILCVFVIGSAELIITGVLPELSEDLNVSVGAAGLLVTIYAFAVAIGGPIVAAATLRVNRKTLLVGLMLLFVVGNVICAVSGAYAGVAAGRVISAVAQGSLFASTAVIAISMVDPSKVGRTLAALAFGLNLATVVGTPAGTAVASQHGWRASFVLLAVLGLAFAGLSFVFVPKVSTQTDASPRKDMRMLTNHAVLQAICITALAQAGLFTAVTYIAPILANRGFDGQLWLVLLIFGIASAIGNIGAGYLADWKPAGSLLASVALLAVSLVGLWMAPTGPTAIVAFTAVGCFGFAIIPGLQARIMNYAAEAPTLALTFNVSAFNIGNGLGALLGSMLLALGAAVSVIPLAGAILVAFSALLLIANPTMTAKDEERDSVTV